MIPLRDTILGVLATIIAITAIGAMYIDFKLSEGNRALQNRIAQRQTIIADAVQNAMNHGAMIQYVIAFAQQRTDSQLLKVLDDHGYSTVRPVPPPGGMPRMQRSWPVDPPADSTSQDGQTGNQGAGSGTNTRPGQQGTGQPGQSGQQGQPGRPGSDARR